MVTTQKRWISRAMSSERNDFVKASPKIATEVMAAQLDPYERASFVEVVVPALAQGGLPSVEMWSSLLNAAIDSEVPAKAVAAGHDLSLEWRPDITDDSDADKRDAKSAFTTAIIKTCDLVLEDDPRQIAAVVASLSRHTRSIFKRIALYILELHPDTTLVRQYLTDRANFAEPASRRDYRMLARARADLLEVGDMERIIEWIQEGDSDKFARVFRAAMGRPPAKADVHRHVGIWRRDWLRAFRRRLPEELATELDELEMEFPGPQEERSAVRFTTWSGSTGPLSSEELRQLAAADLIHFAKKWKPPRDPFGPSIDGLVNQITQAVSTAPSDFLTLSPAQLEGSDPTVINAIVTGVQRAFESAFRPPWADVISFSAWAVDQKKIPARGGDLFDYQLDWTDTQLAVARLLSSCLNEKSDPIPLEEAPRMWHVIEGLAGSVHPTPEFEFQYGPPNMSPMTLSLNTVRAQALLLAIDYASWQRRWIGEEWAGLPNEVRDLLEAHLTPGGDPSIAVRSVYGNRLPALFYLDHAWVESHLTLIFGKDSRDAMGQVAWHDYLLNQVFIQVFNLLEPQYWMATEAQRASPRDGLEDAPELRLAVHLAVVYVWGRLETHGSPSLIQRFFELADPIARHRFLETIGEILEANPIVPPEVAARLTRLWEWRWDSLAETDSAGRCEELRAFGQWFATGGLEPSWSLSQLERLMTSCGVVDNEYRTLQRLAILSDAFPKPAVAIVGVLSDKGGSSFYAWEDAAKQILRHASAHSDADARTLASEMVNRLVAKGFTTFLDFA
ncbi:MAG TPA: hypothetical protein DEV93_03635 [Chloroflexi bacterium]|jgi:hypothetical protein|nr:hypothetical protein [Chloroflexota bacterium]